MDKISIEETPKTPKLVFTPDDGKIEIKGRSIPENAIDFYRPFMELLEKYSASPKDVTEINIQLEYFNTSSSKCILDILKKLESMYKNGSNIVVNWYYEKDDEDMLESGEDYQSIIKIPFNMIEVDVE